MMRKSSSHGFASTIVLIVVVAIIIAGAYFKLKTNQYTQISVSSPSDNESSTPSPTATPTQQESPIATQKAVKTLAPKPTSTPSSSINISMACWRYEGHNTESMQVDLTASISNPNKQAVYLTVTDEEAKKTLIFLVVKDDSLMVKTDAILKGIVNSTRGNPDSIEFKQYLKYTFKAYTAPYADGVPDLKDLKAQTTASEDCQ
jgi:uncharacterized protein (UPF0333 family)